jgi:glycosyltransferase involved in cell wall biosynthesis
VFTGAILPSNSSEPHPLSFIEYAMMGKPILCHSNNSMADYVLKYNNGNTFNFENDCNLLNKTNELANNKREFSSNSRKLYLEEFAEEVWIKRLESLIYKYK